LNVALTEVLRVTPVSPASGVWAVTAGVRRGSLASRTTASTK
jgi:hypothetical protein